MPLDWLTRLDPLRRRRAGRAGFGDTEHDQPAAAVDHRRNVFRELGLLVGTALITRLGQR